MLLNLVISTKNYYYFFILNGTKPDKISKPIQKYINFGRLSVKNNPTKRIDILAIFINNSLPQIYVFLSSLVPRI